MADRAAHAPERPAPDARPREKLLARGPGALGDAELLALLLRTGLAGKSVLQLAQELLEHFGGIAGLLHASADDLKRIKGLGGSAKRAELVAVLELARRALAEQLRERAALDTPQAVSTTCSCTGGARARGVCRAVSGQPAPADRAGRAVSRHADADQRVPARGGAARPAPPGRAVVLAHNHPSGSTAPSRADEALTQNLKAALALVDVRVLDHVIVAPGRRCRWPKRAWSDRRPALAGPLSRRTVATPARWR
jgi:DNA repair protein RadC